MTCAGSSTVAGNRARAPRSLGIAASVASTFFTFFATATTARADGNAAAAETLFRDGMALFDAGRYSEACPKLADSHRLDPASGTSLALALCHEKEGKTASAWGEYIDAASLARRDGRPDREAAARKRATELEPLVSRLTINVDPRTKALPEIVVRRDGETVVASALGGELPIDPGDHEIEAQAPGKRLFHTTVHVLGDGERKTVDVPLLEDEAPSVPNAVVPAVVPAPQAERSGSGTRAAGWIIGGVGVATIGAGAMFGGLAISRAHDSKTRCPEARCQDAGAVALNDDARTAATISTILIGAGALVTAAGAYFVVTSYMRPRSAATSVSVRPTIGVGGLGLDGAW